METLANITPAGWVQKLKKAHPGGSQLPRRAVSLDAGVGPAEACRGDPVGIEALPRHGQASKPKPKKSRIKTEEKEALEVVGAG